MRTNAQSPHAEAPLQLLAAPLLSFGSAQLDAHETPRPGNLDAARAGRRTDSHAMLGDRVDHHPTRAPCPDNQPRPISRRFGLVLCSARFYTASVIVPFKCVSIMLDGAAERRTLQSAALHTPGEEGASSLIPHGMQFEAPPPRRIVTAACTPHEVGGAGTLSCLLCIELFVVY